LLFAVERFSVQLIKVWLTGILQNLRGTRREAGEGSGGNTASLNGGDGLVGKIILIRAPLDEILPEDDSVKRGKSRQAKPTARG